VKQLHDIFSSIALNLFNKVVFAIADRNILSGRYYFTKFKTMLLSLRFTIFYCYVRTTAVELLIHPVDCIDIRRIVVEKYESYLKQKK